MKLKSLILVVVALAVVSVAAHFLTRPKAAPIADTRVGQPLIAPEIVDQARSLRLKEQDKTVTLNKGDDGVWRVAEYYDFPADFTKLSRIVGELVGAKLERLVTQNPERIKSLDLGNTRLAFSDAANKETWSIHLGRSADGGGRFLRFGEENKAFLARLNTYLDVEPKNWADTQLLTLKSDDVARVELSFTDGTAPLIAQRAKKDDAFIAEQSPTGKRLRSERILSLIGSVGTLRFSETSELTDPNAVAAKAHARSVVFTTFDGKSYTVSVGRKPEQKVIKAPEAKKDGSTGPAALGTLTDLSGGAAAKADEKSDGKEKAEDGHGPAKVAETTETIPAGPVFVVITTSDAKAGVNSLMQKRAFQVYESVLTGLPATSTELFEDAPAPSPTPAGANGPSAP
ncbi:MAG TPA: DUF4340 domain-containing protein [Opitutaceae bacterium]|nr:DUF4340 domain-containing protein [Opitutaceae bacterium]